MAKKESVEITPEQERIIVETKDVLASKQDVLIKIGQVQAFDFINKLATVATLKNLENIKKTQAYKGLTYTSENGELATVANWEECCKYVIGVSARSIDDRLINLEAFGEEFFEASQTMKLGYRDLRKLRQLPEGDQTLVIDSEAVELGDKEAVKELIEELTIQHKEEKDDLTGALHEAESQLAANREMSNETAIKLQEAQEKLAQRKFKATKWQDETKDFFAALHKVHNSMTENLNQLMALNEQLEYSEIDERAKDSASAAFFADNKLMVEQFALTWNEIYRTWAHVEETAKPSGELLAEMGFEGLEDEA